MYVDPNEVHTPSEGGFVPASWGDAVRDAANLLGGRRPRTRTYSTFSTIVPSGFDERTPLAGNTVKYHRGRHWSGRQAVSEIRGYVIPPDGAGLYALFGHALFASNDGQGPDGVAAGTTNAAGYRELAVRVNESDVVAVQRTPNTVGYVLGFSAGLGGDVYHDAHYSIQTEWELQAGDIVELVATQTSGANADTAFHPFVSAVGSEAEPVAGAANQWTSQFGCRWLAPLST